MFIDGSNFYHGLKQNKLFDLFQYSSFYAELAKKFDIKEVYFYDAVKNIDIEPKQYAKQQAFHSHLQKAIPNLVIRLRKLKYVFVNDRLERAKKNANFCTKCTSKVDPFLSDAGLQKIS